MASSSDDPGGTPIRMPVWVLVHEAGLRDPGLPAALTVLGGPGFGHFACLFTALDAADSFLAVAGLPGVVPLGIGTFHVLGAALDDVYRRGVYSVGQDLHFPPGEDAPTGRFFPIRPLVETVFGRRA